LHAIAKRAIESLHQHQARIDLLLKQERQIAEDEGSLVALESALAQQQQQQSVGIELTLEQARDRFQVLQQRNSSTSSQLDKERADLQQHHTETQWLMV
jgi:hypothetical protein